MSQVREPPSGGESSQSSPPPAKKRRTPGACDNCKKKKIRCDSADMLGNRCTNCIQTSMECTHKEVSKTLGSAKGYVERLETRLEKMEQLLTKLLPQADLNRELGIPEDPDLAQDSLLLSRNDDDLREEELIGKLKRLHVNPPRGRFFGKSSGYQLVQTALDIRRDYVGKERNANKMPALGTHRSDLWLTPPWHPSHFEKQELPSYSFPDSDLQSTLIDAYFRHINPFFPLFHRPSFNKSLADNLHQRDRAFGGTVLLVCALGSRHSDDPRVLYHNTTSFHSAGWIWFEQVSIMRTDFNDEPTLGELQNHALSVLFLQSSETPQGCWTQLGMALRMAQEVGAHRRRALKAPTAEDEQWKRVFWVLTALDRFMSSFSGRQCMMPEEDYDVELPIECDDEYWENPNPSLAFRQPADKPSTITYFNCYLRLTDILASAMRAIYSVKKLTSASERSTRYVDQKIVMELDSAMNNWMDSVPDHLRWDSSPKDELFLQQSATLYASYYHLQIFIHRPFIPSFRNRSPTSFPSLAICTNAARSCCHVLEVQTRGGTSLPLPNLQITIFTAAVALLLNIWNGKRSGVAPHPRRDLDDVQKCFNILTACEQRWSASGRFLDILMDLVSAGDLPFSRSTDKAASVKRSRDPDAPLDVQMLPRQNSEPRDYRKVVATQHPISIDTAFPDGAQPSPFAQTVNFELPMYGTDLGKLPVYGQFNFSESRKRPRREPDNTNNRPPFSFAPPENNISRTAPAHDFAGSVTNPRFPPENDFASMGWDQFAYSTDATTPHATAESFGPREPEMFGADGVPTMDHILSMWSSTPTGFELNDWGNYITGVDRFVHPPGA